jgi:hypothetical protein
MSDRQVEVSEENEVEKMNFWQSLVYKWNAIRVILRSKHFLLIDVKFAPDFSKYDADIKRYKLSRYGTEMILKETGEAIAKNNSDTELVEKIPNAPR